MNETFYPYLKAKGNQFEISPRHSSEAQLPSRENSSAMPRQFTLGIISPIRPKNAPLTVPLPAEHTSGSRMIKFANMSGVGSKTAGPLSLLLDALKSYILNYPSVMSPFTNGSTLMPENLSHLLFGPTAIARDEDIPDVIRKRIFPIEYQSKNAPKGLSHARNLGIGKQTLLSHVKVLLLYKSALNARPGLQRLANWHEKERMP